LLKLNGDDDQRERIVAKRSPNMDAPDLSRPVPSEGRASLRRAGAGEVIAVL
jgi:hypothetical protein